MATGLEDLKVLQAAEVIADGIWKHVMQWDTFERDTVGKQLARATDSIGANIAEAFGRFHYGEKLQFLYYARGSLFESKYWLNRALARDLMPAKETQRFASLLTDLARQLNAFANSLKAQRHTTNEHTKTVHDGNGDYIIEARFGADGIGNLFGEDDLEWLHSLPENL